MMPLPLNYRPDASPRSGDLVVHSDGYYSEATGALAGFVVTRNGAALVSGCAVAADLPDGLVTDSTAAEYWAVGFAARRAIGFLDPGRLVHYRCDSQSVVHVLCGQAKARGLYVELVEWVLAGVGKSEWTLEWIPRGQNGLVDKLSRGDRSTSTTRKWRREHDSRCYPSKPTLLQIGTFTLLDIARISAGETE